MADYNRHSPGGIAVGKIRKQQALDRYYANPNICKYCNQIIEVKEGQKVATVREKVFCDSTCSATYNNTIRILKRPKRVKLPKVKKEWLLLSITKGDLFEKRSNWQCARSSIQKHARKVLLESDIPKECKTCGYTNHVEACHIKSVKDFSDDSLISEINDIKNLMYLCPNHHWEFDNGILNIAN